jgi:hypothetical protein
MADEPLPPLLTLLVIGGLVIAGWALLVSLVMCAREVLA